MLPPAPASSAPEGGHVEPRLEGVGTERGHALHVLGPGHDPQGEALLGAHLGDVEPRGPLDAHPQGEGAAPGAGPVPGQRVAPADPAAAGQVQHENAPVEVHAQVLAPPGHRRAHAAHEGVERGVEGLEGGDGGQLAALDATTACPRCRGNGRGPPPRAAPARRHPPMSGVMPNRRRGVPQWRSCTSSGDGGGGPRPGRGRPPRWPRRPPWPACCPPARRCPGARRTPPGRRRAPPPRPRRPPRPPRPPPRRPCPPCRCRPRCSGRRAGACSAAASPCRSTTASPRWGRSRSRWRVTRPSTPRSASARS